MLRMGLAGVGCWGFGCVDVLWWAVGKVEVFLVRKRVGGG